MTFMASADCFRLGTNLLKALFDLGPFPWSPRHVLVLELCLVSLMSILMPDLDSGDHFGWDEVKFRQIW